jgi:putative NADH-flavin reductase
MTPLTRAGDPMRLFVLGASGHTGTQILDLALARSHSVTAFVRSPDKIMRRDSKLTVLAGNPRNLDQLRKAMQGHDAVLSSLGVRPPLAFRPHSVVRDCAATTVQAMSGAGVNRLVLVSAAVLFPMRGIVYGFFRRILKHIARDLGGAEAIVRDSSLEWTIARPPRLINGSEARYRASRDSLPSQAFSMSFRAVAAFMLDAVERHSHVQEIVGLARG